jgi:hypothetical protein
LKLCACILIKYQRLTQSAEQNSAKRSRNDWINSGMMCQTL